MGPSTRDVRIKKKSWLTTKDTYSAALQSFGASPTIKTLVGVRERSHMTSAAEGGGGFEMLTRGRGLSLADVRKNT